MSDKELSIKERAEKVSDKDSYLRFEEELSAEGVLKESRITSYKKHRMIVIGEGVELILSFDKDYKLIQVYS